MRVLVFGLVAVVFLIVGGPSFARSISELGVAKPYAVPAYDGLDDYSEATPPVVVPLPSPPPAPVPIPSQAAPPSVMPVAPAQTPTVPGAPLPAAVPPPPVTPGTADVPPPDGTEPVDPNAHDHTDDDPDDSVNIGEVPAIETVELTEDTARKALDGFVLVRDKYKDAELENYETLQDFVDQNSLGKAFEADIKQFGFPTVNQWNVAISTVGFAYNNSLDDQTEEIAVQVEEIKADVELAQDMKDRMIASLNATIPSENNKKVLDALLKDPNYSEKLKLLENEGE
jgi:hypothetical protein